MDREERYRLVARNTAEIVTEEELDSLLDRDPTIYIGYAPTGEMHIGHFTTIRKLADFLQAGLDVKVLIADLHAHLDDEKSPFDLLDARSAYYREAIEGMVAAAGADPKQVEFVPGREFELSSEYSLDLLRMAADTTVARTRRAGSEVVRQSENPTLGGLLYPLLQSLDVAALEADIAYGGIDQRGIYMLSREVLPEHGYDAPVCLFAPLLSGLTGGKMSASEAGSSITITDDSEAVKQKVADAYCPQGEVEDNGVLEYLEYLIFPILDERKDPFVIERPEEYGGNVTYEGYAALEADFVSKGLHPQDLKTAAATYIDEAIAPIRDRFADRPNLLIEAYPETYD
ncbi:tyrosine--tRNA ligase [Halobacteriales archaeon QS_3_64_16]|nr:MAG: tyrosine--tRNA ligase [Halobacteriales archaeon QS_3_64_16]